MKIANDLYYEEYIYKVVVKQNLRAFLDLSIKTCQKSLLRTKAHHAVTHIIVYC